MSIEQSKTDTQPSCKEPKESPYKVVTDGQTSYYFIRLDRGLTLDKAKGAARDLGMKMLDPEDVKEIKSKPELNLAFNDYSETGSKTGDMAYLNASESEKMSRIAQLVRGQSGWFVAFDSY